MEIKNTDLQAEEGLPWHKPRIQLLDVKFDTENTRGSGPDALTVEVNT